MYDGPYEDRPDDSDVISRCVFERLVGHLFSIWTSLSSRFCVVVSSNAVSSKVDPPNVECRRRDDANSRTSP